MRFPIQFLLWLLLSRATEAATVTYTVPTVAPTSAAVLDLAPLGISYISLLIFFLLFEFFTFPSYILNLTNTHQCLSNLQSLSGIWPPIRIGGTTQDRATFDPALKEYVDYEVAASTDAPSALTFGPKFMDLAATYAGTVVLGLNRGHNNLTNTIAAAVVAKGKMANLIAIELGNEPEYWVQDNQPIAIEAGTWDPASDAESQDEWDISVGEALGKQEIIQAGNSNSAPPTWGAAELIATENATVRAYVHDYAHHNYPGGTVQSLMSHADIVSNLAIFTPDVKAATNVGKEYVLGETNSVSGGGASTVSPLFGAALWTLDYTLRATTLNIKRTYFHHGTIGACYYCFWGSSLVNAPYYGAYTATAFLAGGSYISALDSGTDSYGGYIVYDSLKAPLRGLLYNSNYYSGTGTRSNQVFTMGGLGASGVVTAKRLTATSASSRVDEGQNPSFGGQAFANMTCEIEGTELFESTAVKNGVASFTVGESEAVLFYLQLVRGFGKLSRFGG